MMTSPRSRRSYHEYLQICTHLIIAERVVAAETGNTPVVLWLIETYNVPMNSTGVAEQEEDTLMEGRDVYNTPLEAATDTGEEETALALLGLEGQDMNVDSFGQDGQCVLSYAANNDMVSSRESWCPDDFFDGTRPAFAIVPSGGIRIHNIFSKEASISGRARSGVKAAVCGAHGTVPQFPNSPRTI